MNTPANHDRADGIGGGVPPLCVLVVDDHPQDVRLMLDALAGQPYRVISRVVNNAGGMREALAAGPSGGSSAGEPALQWDCILADDSIPGFNAAAALVLARELRPDIPFIIVSGDIDLSRAIELIRAGARDYVNKRELIRLGHVVQRELHECRLEAERIRAEEAVRESEERFRAIVENVGDLVVMLDVNGKRLYNSPSYRPLFSEEEIRIGSDSFTEVHPEDRDRIREVFRRTVATGVGERAEFRFVLKNGEIRHIESEGRAIHGADGKVAQVIVVSRDITERKRLEIQLLEMATTDFLTSIPNRRYFVARLDEELARIQRIEGQRASVLMLDVDHFKRINDQFGHEAGDNSLRHLALLLKNELRKMDTAGRLGGDEFAMILPGTTVDAAQAFAERLRQKVYESPLVIRDRPVHFTVSIGISAILPLDTTPSDAINRADHALYRAKELGRNCVQLTDEANPPG